MFNFKRGNSRNPEGRATLYLKDSSRPGGRIMFPALYVSPNLSDLAFSGKPIDLSKPNAFLNPKLMRRGISFYRVFFRPEAEPSLSDRPGDIVYLGETTRPWAIPRMLDVGMDLYAIKHSAQQQAKKPVAPENFRMTLYNLGIGLMTAIERGQDLRGLAAIRSLIEFGQGQPFQQPVEELTELILRGDPRNGKIMDHYVDLAEAIMLENYKEAAKLRDQIARAK